VSGPAFDIELREPAAIPSPRRVRVRAGDEWVADSRTPLLLRRYGPGILPTYCFSPDEVWLDLVADLGDAAELLEGLEGEAAPANGHWTFAWDGRVRWFEEATEVFVHARDPQHRVDVVPSDRHVRVQLDGTLLAETRRASAIFETSLPTRWYFPAEDVVPGALEPAGQQTRCPFKGRADLYRVPGGATVAWSYFETIPECPGVAGRFAFYNERVDLTLDGELQKRPFTPWSLDLQA
jgi:uncharacterized protein (DUF427 family)